LAQHPERGRLRWDPKCATQQGRGRCGGTGWAITVRRCDTNERAPRGEPCGAPVNSGGAMFSLPLVLAPLQRRSCEHARRRSSSAGGGTRMFPLRFFSRQSHGPSVGVWSRPRDVPTIRGSVGRDNAGRQTFWPSSADSPDTVWTVCREISDEDYLMQFIDVPPCAAASP